MWSLHSPFSPEPIQSDLFVIIISFCSTPYVSATPVFGHFRHRPGFPRATGPEQNADHFKVGDSGSLAATGNQVLQYFRINPRLVPQLSMYSTSNVYWRLCFEACTSNKYDSSNHNFTTNLPHEIGPLALPEMLQATLLRIHELGFFKGILGSLVIFWLLIGLGVLILAFVGRYVRHREIHLQDKDRREVEEPERPWSTIRPSKEPAPSEVDRNPLPVSQSQKQSLGRYESLRSAFSTQEYRSISTKRVRWKDEELLTDKQFLGMRKESCPTCTAASGHMEEDSLMRLD